MARADRSAHDAWSAAGIFAVCTIAYVATLSPGLAHLGADGRELTVVAATLGLAHPTGYPLYTWIGHGFVRLAPVGDVAYRVNLMSAVLGAAGVALLYLVARRLRMRAGIAAFTALLFGASPTFWSQAVVAEVYAPNVAALALLLWLLLRWAERVDGGPARGDRAFVVFALAYGLSLGMHLSNLLFAPAFTLFVLLTDRAILRRPKTVALALAAFLAGTAQFAWLPLRAGVRDLFPNVPPDTPATFYDYTLGAFANLRFAFPLETLPERLTAYLAFLIDNFSIVGLVAGFAGMAVLLRRDVRAFWLLVPMWAIHVMNCTQLLVPDPEPFFIASNLVFALCIGASLEAACGRVPSVRPNETPLALRVALAVWVGAISIASFRTNDQTGDTVVGDFHRAAFALLPPGSILVPRGGAFGSDVAYHHEVLGMRPDVHVADRSWRELPPDVPVFTVAEPHPIGARVQFPNGAWFVPVLRGARHDALLYRVHTTAPRILVQDAAPERRADHVFADATLVGWDMPTVTGGRVQTRTYWRVAPSRRVVVATEAAGVMLEAHELGFGELPRYRAETGLVDGGIVVDDLGVVLPAALPAGVHPLRVGVIDASAGTLQPRWVTLGEIEVP